MPHEPTFGKRLRILRERAGKSRAVLGGLVGRSEEWVKALENDRLLTPRLSMLLRLAEVPGVTDVAELTGDQSLPVASVTKAAHAATPAVVAALLRPTRTRDTDPAALDVPRRVARMWELWHRSRTERTARRGPARVDRRCAYRHPPSRRRPAATREAIRRGDTVALRAMPSPTRRASLFLDMAQAHVQQRDHEGVLAMLDRALQESVDTVRHRPNARQAVVELLGQRGAVGRDARKVALAIGLAAVPGEPFTA
jgi:transcriptional regulator with XRE-family HTH domain